jgi:hypothetical protein
LPLRFRLFSLFRCVFAIFARLSHYFAAIAIIDYWLRYAFITPLFSIILYADSLRHYCQIIDTLMPHYYHYAIDDYLPYAAITFTLTLFHWYIIDYHFAIITPLIRH